MYVAASRSTCRSLSVKNAVSHWTTNEKSIVTTVCAMSVNLNRERRSGYTAERYRNRFTGLNIMEGSSMRGIMAGNWFVFMGIGSKDAKLKPLFPYRCLKGGCVNVDLIRRS